MSIRTDVLAYMQDHPEAKRRHIVAALGLTPKQVDNARRVIKHGFQVKKPKPVNRKPSQLPAPHFLSVW